MPKDVAARVERFAAVSDFDLRAIQVRRIRRPQLRRPVTVDDLSNPALSPAGTISVGFDGPGGSLPLGFSSAVADNVGLRDLLRRGFSIAACYLDDGLVLRQTSGVVTNTPHSGTCTGR